jgi:hypothetical protein
MKEKIKLPKKCVIDKSREQYVFVGGQNKMVLCVPIKEREFLFEGENGFKIYVGTDFYCAEKDLYLKSEWYLEEHDDLEINSDCNLFTAGLDTPSPSFYTKYFPTKKAAKAFIKVMNQPKELEDGEWYEFGIFTILKTGVKSGAGFVNGVWKKVDNLTFESWRLADPETVGELLLRKAVNDYPEGTSFENMCSSKILKIKGNQKTYEDNIIVDENGYQLYNMGKWAEKVNPIITIDGVDFFEGDDYFTFYKKDGEIDIYTVCSDTDGVNEDAHCRRFATKKSLYQWLKQNPEMLILALKYKLSGHLPYSDNDFIKNIEEA